MTRRIEGTVRRLELVIAPWVPTNPWSADQGVTGSQAASIWPVPRALC